MRFSVQDEVRTTALKVIQSIIVTMMITIVCVWLVTTPLAAQTLDADGVSLRLINATNPAFDQILEGYFPGITSVEQYQSIRPFLVLLRNDSSLSAKAYAIHWDLTTSEGSQHELTVSFIRRRLLMPQAEHSIKPADVRLVSPLFNLTPRDYADNPYFSSRYPAALYPNFGSSMNVTSSLDGVVYSDGTFVGENRTKILQSYRCSRNAEHDETLAILSAVASENSTDLAALLRQHVQKGYSGDGSDIHGVYRHARAESATMMLGMLRHMGRKEFLDRLKDVSTAGPTADYSHMAAWF